MELVRLFALSWAAMFLFMFGAFLLKVGDYAFGGFNIIITSMLVMMAVDEFSTWGKSK